MRFFKDRRYHLPAILLLLAVTGAYIYWTYDPLPKYKLEKLYINIGEEELDKLSAFKDQAMVLGYLERSEDDYVPADVLYRSESSHAKIRLKGDWTDHLQDNKWSFRIKLKNAMNDGLKVFSVQAPSTRGHLKGYLFHKLLKQEGVLTTEFRFVNLFVNNKSWGAYCLEEHLTSRLISSQGRPDGIILKFNDQAFFENQTNESPNDELIKTARIKTYGDAAEDKRYKSEKKEAIRIMTNYQNQRDSLYGDFDAQKMGTYYAVCDLATAYHSMGWINIRFYYNFETGLMEPIGYDGYPILDWGKPYLGKHAPNYIKDKLETKMVIYSALKDSAILKEYNKALKRITQEDYVDKFMKKYRTNIQFYADELQLDDSDYQFDSTFLYQNAAEIDAALHVLD
ncbi:CotH kinase family protein [Crocinitomix sp.]|nr:CotH kinase family protein [Crocinitomix sp.]